MSHLVFTETSGSGVHALACAKRAGHTVTYLYSPRYDFTAPPGRRALARRLADHTGEIHGERRAEDLVTAVRAAGARPGDVDAVLSTLAFGAPLASALADALGTRGTPVDGVAAARDKGRCRAMLREAGIPSLAFSVVRSEREALDAATDIGYPVIIKPALGVGKAATSIADGPAAVRGHFAGAAEELRTMPVGMSGHFDGRYLVEELAVGDLYSVEVASDGRSFVPLVSAARKTGVDNPVLELGCSVPSGLGPAEEDELGAYAARVCRVLGLSLGVFHVEVMHTENGFRLIEANPRMAGGSLPETINAVSRRDIFGLLVDLFLGHPAPAGPLTLDAAASHSLLAAASARTIRPDLPPHWFDAYLARVHSGWVRVAGGDRVDVMRGNFDTFGVIRTVAADAERAQACCAAVKGDVERELGVPLLAENTRTLIRR
ncbi:ATP-grasp domain-containing protein [Pseudonocardia acaciae]|uniref:ATP-grasp domain-containing protein n=1 Tax=Pseudonocardia acaciae TaxID=551276 RepID=UPI0004912B32|nr:ATP-grasp domain-containing protein [Pseudonocardia acaciae]